jgi:hypothetical protein
MSFPVVVISDTHLPRFAARLPVLLARVAAERPRLILHCGDLTTLAATAAFESIAPVEAVAGNDGGEIVARYGRRKIVSAADFRIGMIHGDGSRGTTLGRARAAFKDDAVDAIVFGHSHIPYLERHDGVWAINPGSGTDKRHEPRYSFAVIATGANGELAPRLVFFDR